MDKKFLLFINGKWVSPKGDRYFTVQNPATEEVIGEVANGSLEDVKEAINTSYEAFKRWKKENPFKVQEILYNAADRIETHKNEIIKSLTMEMGKPLKDSKKEVDFSIKVIRYYASTIPHIKGELPPVENQDYRSLVIREPIGVVSAISPWNYPVELMIWKIAPALAARCTVIAKPPSLAPIATIKALSFFEEAGLPPGVLNIITGSGKQIGDELILNPKVSMVAFTGSVDTGKHVMKLASRTIKRISLELGGNSPMIIFKDADLSWAIPQAVRRCFSNMGQVCVRVNRLYVHEDIFSQFIEGYVEKVRNFQIGNGLEAGIEYGPVISNDVIQRVKIGIEDALKRGAKLIYGGEIIRDRGYFITPAILINVPESAMIVREEMFGPIIPILKFSDDEDVIKRANNTRYGLAAYIFTKDIKFGLKVAERIEAGGIGVNINDMTELTAPFGGYKESGIGRELSLEGLYKFTQLKHIRINIK